jgi:hypothetical protein
LVTPKKAPDTIAIAVERETKRKGDSHHFIIRNISISDESIVK